MSSVSVYVFLALLLGLHQKGTEAASSLEVSSGGGNVTDQFLQVCPNTIVSLTCSHDGVDLTRWRVTPPLPMDCDTVITRTASPNSEGLCGSFTISMISSRTEQTRRSTIELLITESLDGAVVTCFAGASSTPNLQVRNLTIQINIGPPSTPTIDGMEYSVVDSPTGQFRFLASSSGTFRTGVIISASVVGGSGSVVVTDNNIIVIGLSYTGSHTVSIVATSAVCPGVLNSSVTVVSVVFNIRTPVLTQPTGSVDCSNPSLPISGSWSVVEGVQSSNNSAVQLAPPPIGTPTITFTSSARGLSGSAVFVPDSSYQLTDTVENDVFTFTVTVTNAAGSSSEMSAAVEVTPFIVDESTLETMNCLTFSLSQNCASEQSGNFVIKFEQRNGVCRDLVLSDFSTSTIQLMPQSACAYVASSTNLCYRATLMYNGIITDTQTNLNFAACPISVLNSFLADGVSYQLDGEVTSGNVSHRTTATLSCTETFASVSGAAVVTCVDGQWNNMGIQWCSRSCAETTAISVIVTFLLTLALGISIGVLFVLAVNKYRKSEKVTLQTETEMGQPPVAIYEDLDVVKPDPRTQGNLAYGHVHAVS
ncbi:uncharacterized protein LOC135344348 isoform X2 [Halichondria panicea]|uniref:uncharacterized protein LOC135344348 isoform X2 n=1 Tax=Halichondria panicea TaxID=6063 RepID=UPI00312B7D45